MVMAVEGLRVLDLTRLLPGPYCTQFLCDFGAEVIKVEEPERGDYARWAPPFVSGTEVGYRMLALDRGKKSITLNLKDERGCEAFYRLAKTADVIMEGFRPKVVNRLKIDYDTIKEMNPRVVYCSLSGYGQSGPYEKLTGHDLNYISIGGLEALLGERDRAPIVPGIQIADLGGGGMLALIGILFALMARDRTGRGQYVDIAMLDGVVHWFQGAAAYYFAEGHNYQRGEGRTGGHFACYNIYECKDGKYLSIGALEEWFWANLCRELGREDYIEPQFAEGAKREEILQFFRSEFKKKTRDEWFAQLADKDICVGPVNLAGEVFADPQVLHRELLVSTQHPKYGEVKQVGIPIKLSDTPGKVPPPGPELGEHTDELLGEVGFGADEIASLRRDKVIR